jgi:hypothetical protein
MISEAKERVTRMLRSKAADSVEEEVRETIRRAQAALNDSPEHPLAGKLREQVQSMQRALQKKEHEKLESLSLEAMRTLAQIESSGA